jgi:type II secretory pathway pseudopilin PulG
MSYCAHCGAEVPDGAAFCPRCGKSPAGPAMAAKPKSNATLFIILGCLAIPLIIAILGIIAAIVIPNFLDAMQKAKQKRAVDDLQHMGETIEVYKAGHGTPPVANDMASLAAAIGGNAKNLTALDPWQHPYQYICWHEGGVSASDQTSAAAGSEQTCDHYRIGSGGRDGRFQRSLMDYGTNEFEPTDFDRDIVFGDGKFIAWPSPHSH